MLCFKQWDAYSKLCTWSNTHASLEVVGVVLGWVLSTYRAFFLCTVQLVVQSALALLDAATEAIADAVQAAGQALEAVLRTLMQATQGAADVAVDTLNSVLGIFGEQIDAPQWSEPAAFQILRNITLPPSLVHPFQSLTLPTVDSLRAASKDTFQDVLRGAQRDVRRTFQDVAQALAPPPPSPAAAVRAPPPFCGRIRWDAFDTCVQAVRRLALGSYVAAAVGAACALGAAVGIATLRKGPPASPLHVSRAQTSVRTVFHPLLVFVYVALLAHAGVLQVHIAVTHAVLRRLDTLPRRPDPAPVNLNDADAVQVVNAQLNRAQTALNEVLARNVQRLVPGAFDAVNALLDLFSQTIHDVLGTTPLQAPAQQFVMCLVGNKVLAAERALGRLQQALHLALPTMPPPTWVPAPALVHVATAAAERDVLRPLYRRVGEELAAMRHDQLVALLLLAASLVLVLVHWATAAYRSTL